jgi:hypothetical protein
MQKYLIGIKRHLTAQSHYQNFFMPKDSKETFGQKGGDSL